MTFDPTAIDELDIAITGIGCRFPDADGPEAYWRNLVSARESIRTLTEAELQRAGVPPAEYLDPSYVRAASMLEGVDQFDAAFFGYSPKEAEFLDPQVRVFLECAWEALEDAGHDPSTHASPVGVFVAASPTTYLLTSLRHTFDHTRFTLAPGNLQHYLGNASEFIATRVSYKLNMRGPSMSVQSACSGSLVAVHLARQSLLSGESSLALAGGVSIYLPQDVGYQHRDGLILSPDGKCRPFDALAAGTVFGRGAGVVVLKRLTDAVRDGDRVYAVVKGSAINNDGSNKVGFTAPSVSGQADVIAEALANAGVRSDSIGYVEAHGTATAQGDPIEIAGLTQAFGEGTTRRQYCAIGSVKGNIGHLDAAAGMAGLIKTVLALDRELIPASLHYTQPNPVIDFTRTPFYVNASGTAWPRSARPRRAGVSAFGMGGTNAHVVVEEGPAVPAEASAERGVYVVTLSGKTAAAVAALAGRYAAYIEGSPARLSDVCFTANVGRAQLGHRAAIVTRSRAELVTQLRAVAAGTAAPGVVTGEVRGTTRPRVAFLFTGQGAQYAGMGRALYETQPVFRAAVDACAAALAGALAVPLLDVLYGDRGDLIDETAYAQPALYAVEVGLAALWAAWGIEPGAVLGHSVGEYAGAVVAGAVPRDEAARLIATRGRLLQALPRTGAMAAVMAPAAVVEAALAGEPGVGLAAVNAPDAVVIAGPTAGVAAVGARLTAQGIEVQALTVSHAFHSALVEPMLAAWGQAAAQVPWQTPRTTVVAGRTGQVAAAGDLASADYWRRQVREPVQFAAGLTTVVGLGYDACVEVGPQPTLTALGRRAIGDASVWWGGALRRGRDDWEQVLTAAAGLWVRGARVDWTAVDAGWAPRKVALPTYPFQRTRFWVDAVKDKNVASAAAGSGGRRHQPFAGLPITSPAIKDRVVEFELAPDAPPFLDDHRICGTPVVPMTGFVEMVLDAAGGAGGTIELASLQLTRALMLSDGELRRVQVIVRSDANGDRTFELFSARSDDGRAAGPTWTPHGEGRLRDAGPLSGLVDVDQIRARCPVETSGAAYYGTLREEGLEYGAAFQGIETVWHAAGEALARMAYPSDLVASAHEFHAHPALVDACLQAAYAAFPERRTADSIFLPTSIDRLHLSSAVAQVRWSHITLAEGDDPSRVSMTVRLGDADGRLLGTVEGLVMRRAPRSLFESTAQAMRQWFYDFQWRRQPLAAGTGALASTWPPRAADVAPPAGEIDIARATYGADVYDTLEPILDERSREYVVAALHELGWTSSPGQRFSTADVAARLGVLPRYHRMLDRMFDMLADDGLVARDGVGWREVRIDPPAGPAPGLDDLLRSYPTCQAELTVFSRCGAALAAVLSGAQDPLELLFPGGSLSDLEALYTTSSFSRAFNALVRRTIESAMLGMPASRTARIVEIGAGTGGTASWVLPVLPPGRAEYTFTDVSNLFLARARERFQQYGSVQYRLLDMEREPESQGFAAGGYDIVLATNVLHATEDLARTMRRARSLLAPGGLLVMVEAIAPQRWVDIIFGLTDGWWKFSDSALRPSYPLLRIPQWRTLLGEVGFDGVTFLPGEDRSGALCHQTVVVANAPGVPAWERTPGEREHWLVVGSSPSTMDQDALDEAAQTSRVLAGRGAGCTVVRLNATDDKPSLAGLLASVPLAHTETPRVLVLTALGAGASRPDGHSALQDFQRRVTGSTLYLVQALLDDPRWQSASLTVVTRGAQPVGDRVASVSEAAQATLWGLGRTIALEHPELRCRRIDLDPAQPFDAEGLVTELGADPSEDEVGLRGGARYVARLAHTTVPVAASAPSVPDPVQLDVQTPGVLDSLRPRAVARRAPGPHEVEVQVAVAGLNFKDVLIALGTLPRLNDLGLECTGVVTRVGEAVTAITPGEPVVVMAPGSFATFLTVPQSAVVRRPPGLSDEDAATVPVAFVTAAFALDRVARLKAGERVLIHAATGAVGMAAVQIARRAGAEIFATAGSEEKRAALRAAGIAHVMDSRSLAFADEIRTQTGGRGVDVVLNSLASAFVQAGLSVLAPGGRFVELGKTAVLSGTALRQVPGDQQYRAIDVNTEFDAAPAEFNDLLASLLASCADGSLTPLPKRVYSAADATEAFRLMALAGHQGKLLIRFGETGARARIRGDATYLITGAFGGLGVLVAQWLVDRGARSLALMGRHEPTGAAAAAVETLRRAGVRVRVQIGDVGVFEDVRRAVAGSSEEGTPLAGVFHAAGIVADRGLVQQDWGRFERVFAAKVHGAWHLHELTRQLPLDHFVLFSTAMAVLGSAGQANHAAANAYMDALASARRGDGLAGLSIGWGPWSAVGAAVALNVTERFTAQGLQSIPPAEGLQALDALVAAASAGGPAYVGVMPMAWPTYLRQSPARHLGRLSEIRAEQALSGAAQASRQPSLDDRAPAASGQAGVLDVSGRVGAAPMAEKERVLVSCVRELVAHSLGLPTAEPIDADRPLAEVGLDSLLAVEVRSVLGAALGRTFPASLLFDYPTLDAIAGYLGREVFKAEPWVRVEVEAADAQVGDALSSIEQMDDDEVERLLAGRLSSGGVS